MDEASGFAVARAPEGRSILLRCARRVALTTLVWILALVAVVIPVPSVSFAASDRTILNASVPSICGYPAGRLVNGVLPGTAPGNVFFTSSSIRRGNFARGPALEAVVHVHCDGGGIGWPEALLFFDSRGHAIAVRDLSDYFSQGIATVRSIRFVRKQIYVQVDGIGQDGDAMCCGTATATLVYAWNASSHSIALKKKKVVTEARTDRSFLRALNDNRLRDARRLGSPEVVRIMSTASITRKPFSMLDCEVDEGQYSGGSTVRQCWASGRGMLWILHMHTPSFGKWYVSSVDPVYPEGR